MSELDNIKSGRHFYSDLSFWSLLIANIITIVWALKQEWSLDRMIWVYFFQNIILGFFWPAKVFATAVDSSYTKKVQSIAIFIPHYFVLHLVYADCLYHYFNRDPFVHLKPIIILAGIFFISEIISFFSESSINRHISLAKVQFLPYARVVPMTFVVIVGLFIQIGTVSARFSMIIFMLLKALADMAMYMVERSSFFGDYSDLREKQIIYRKEKGKNERDS